LVLGDFLKMYTAFVNAYDNIWQVLSALKNSKKFQSFVQKVKKADPTVSNLESLMIMPIQRIPRYLLLLKELKKNTPEFHRDYPALVTATDRLALITSHINSAKANFENVTKVKRFWRNSPFDNDLIDHSNGKSYYWI
jgi:hypothetical protein